jgi:hypothetical protein
MEIINNIKYLFNEKNDKYYLKLGKFFDGLNNIKLFETDKLKLEISGELTNVEAALVLENILITENDFKLNSIIVNELYISFAKHITDMKIINNKCFNNDYLTYNNYLWIIGFIDQIIFKLKTIKTIKIINISSMVMVNNLYLNNRTISKKIEKQNSGVYEKLSLKILWHNKPEYIISIDTSSIDLSTLKAELIKFKSNYYDIKNICYTISKVLKVITVDEYQTMNSNNSNNNINIPIELNNRITPFIKNSQNKLQFKFADDYFQLSFYQLFRCVGINLNKNELILLINFLLYSNYPLDETIKYNWSKMMRNNTYLQIFISLNGSNHISVNNISVNKLYTSYIKILFHQNKEISRYIYKYHYDDVFTKIVPINSENMLQILLNIFINWILNDEKTKKFQMIPSLDVFANKVEKYIDVFNFNQHLKVDIINFLWKNRNNLFNTNLSNPLTKTYLNDFFVIYKNKNNYSANNEGLFTVFNSDKNNKLSESIDDVINNFLFGHLFNKCNLCDENYYCDSVYYMKCDKHQICAKCANKLYFKNNYRQGDYIDECHFVCSFCRQYEQNNFFIIPGELYNNIKNNDLTTIKNYRLCSYIGCNIINRTDVPRLCDIQHQPHNELLTPIYCHNHLTIMRIMTQLNMDTDKNNIEYKDCLKCGVAINKTDGCNHMKCVCGFEFCWVCDYVKPIDSPDPIYKHPSYCRGNYSWEEGLLSLDKLLVEFNKDINIVGLNSSIDLHTVYSKWLNETLATYPIYAVSFWDLDLWIRKKTNRVNNNETDPPNNLNNIGYNISLTIGNIYEWVNNPYIHDIKVVIGFLIGLMTDLKTQHPELFVIPDKVEILLYD